ncbi:hypothetical protein TWF281_006527 [Arthrobotrys megalospora]
MLFLKKALICAFALATPSFAALNADQTAMVTRLSQMATNDFNSKAQIDPMGSNSLVVGPAVMTALQNSATDQVFVLQKAQSGGVVATGLDASAISTVFGLWTGNHGALLLSSVNGRATLLASSFYGPPILAVLNVEHNNVKEMITRFNAMLPGSAYAATRSDILAKANALCATQKQAIILYGGTTTGGASTCA